MEEIVSSTARETAFTLAELEIVESATCESGNEPFCKNKTIDLTTASEAVILYSFFFVIPYVWRFAVVVDLKSESVNFTLLSDDVD